MGCDPKEKVAFSVSGCQFCIILHRKKLSIKYLQCECAVAVRYFQIPRTTRLQYSSTVSTAMATNYVCSTRKQGTCVTLRQHKSPPQPRGTPRHAPDQLPDHHLAMEALLALQSRWQMQVGFLKIKVTTATANAYVCAR